MKKIKLRNRRGKSLEDLGLEPIEVDGYFPTIADNNFTITERAASEKMQLWIFHNIFQAIPNINFFDSQLLYEFGLRRYLDTDQCPDPPYFHWLWNDMVKQGKKKRRKKHEATTNRKNRRG